jgi:flagellar biosynthesis/type III secretory pathway M-ring protein FliF/YscJ
MVFIETYGKIIFNLFLIIAAFFLVVRPLLKSVKGIQAEIVEEAEALPLGQDIKQISEPETANPRQRVIELSNKEPERTAAVIRSWIIGEA